MVSPTGTTADDAASPAPDRGPGGRRRKVACIIGQLAVGGTETQLVRVLSAMDHRTFAFDVLSLNPPHETEIRGRLESIGVGVWTAPAGSAGWVGRTLAMLTHLRRVRPEVVHSWTFSNNPYAAALGRLVGARNAIGSLRGSLSAPASRDLPSWWRRWSIRSVDRIVVNSRKAALELESAGLARRSIALIPNCPPVPLDPARRPDVHAYLASFGIGAGSRVVATVGNLRRVKNQRMFIDGMAPLIGRHRDLYGVIVGGEDPTEPEVRRELLGMIDDLGIRGRMVLTGHVGDVRGILRQASVFCLTSSSEGTPNVILEAMVEDCPVVSTDVGGVSELVTHGETGVLVAPSDSAALTSAVESLLNDRVRASRLANRAATYVREHLSASEAARKLTAVYRSDSSD